MTRGPRDRRRRRFGQVPALEVTTGEQKKILNQSNAILRYIAKMAPAHERYPSDAFEAASRTVSFRRAAEPAASCNRSAPRCLKRSASS